MIFLNKKEFFFCIYLVQTNPKKYNKVETPWRKEKKKKQLPAGTFFSTAESFSKSLLLSVKVCRSYCKYFNATFHKKITKQT